MDERTKILLELDASRHAIRRDISAFRDEIDIPAKARRAFAAHPLPWLGGAALAGFVLSRPRRAPRAARPVAAKAKSLGLLGFVLAFAKMLFPLVRPALSAYAAKRIADLAGRIAR